MSFTKGHIVWFDGRRGMVMDFLGNEVRFIECQVPSSVVPHLYPGKSVLIEDDGYSVYITDPSYSFSEWEEQEREFHTCDTEVLEDE